ncbi:hypothetical protein CH294_20195 [Rhodococcus sp. 14-2483-1-1]|uniref:hypothetical protein n=1 Tax=unclassified Rhodococcus (in: high G+C Gram-positive bacteria) TaxID=192944 RepID=UPI000B9AF4D7|nr:MULTISPECIES: hypothetical protein [unclassified Rhodococcus (in: high G+C Gram-positive bacteria)]OZC44789.1 hypothetical protein CH286_19785 [Rhodococcus sp. WWJCD1]OZF32086.1 hypothetical protein CH294_20195 [Rhodococcus sp. 14-2483-1-1]
MTSGHSELGADLLALADTVLTRLDPILRRVAETQQERDQQGCSWCPVCALAALVRGERHDLVELVASEGTVIIALLRQLLADHTNTGTGHTAAAPAEASPPEPGPDPASTEPVDLSNVSVDTNIPGERRAAFVPITVRVKNSRSDTQDRP